MAIQEDLREFRREIHKYPETGWLEYRTSARIAEKMASLGFDLQFNDDALRTDGRLGLPAKKEVEKARQRAKSEGAPPEYLDKLSESTGLVAEKSYGDGPIVGIRADIDALEVQESQADHHRPSREGFASQHDGVMHACGHDGHIAIALGVAKCIDQNSGFEGTLRVFFQPAEEGGRGGKAMSQANNFSDIEWLICYHLGLGFETGTVIPGYDRPKATTKYQIEFAGDPSHAGRAPENGQNAVQALSSAIQALYGISRHSDGETRINVGKLRSDNPQNVIASQAAMRVETRGETNELNEYMKDKARRKVESAAALHETDVSMETIGEMPTYRADSDLVRLVTDVATSIEGVSEVNDSARARGSDDAAHLIKKVQATGGQATYVGIGASNPSGHHTSEFDIDEEAIQLGTNVISETILGLSNQQ